MKKIYSLIIILVFTIMLSLQFTTIVFADQVKLETVKVEASKSKIAPGEEVTINTTFGKALGAYTINVQYDVNVFDYVRSEGGVQNDEDGKVILTYHYVQGQESPRENASITFKAKESIIADTPTDFSVTLTGLANPDASEEYEDITEAFKPNVLVQPKYVNYTLKLDYTGVILPNIPKDMKLITESPLGKNYDHVRLIATLTKTPSDGATAKLLAIDDEEAQVDLLHSGWGEADGYKLGGKDVKQELALKGEFNELGNYTIHIKLIDRDDEDKTISEKDFNILVGQEEEKEEEPKDNNLPKTGSANYITIILIIAIVATVYLAIYKKDRK